MSDSAKFYGKALFDSAVDSKSEHLLKKQFENIRDKSKSGNCEDAFLKLFGDDISSSFEDIFSGFIDSYNLHYGQVALKVSSAFVLDEKQKRNIIDKVESRTGKKAVSEFVVDKSLIGGVVLEFDDQIIDGSIRAKLNSLSEISVEEGTSSPPPSGNPPPTQRLEVGVLPSAHADKKT